MKLKRPKKNRIEIQPEDIWNKESRNKIREHILSKKQSPKERLKTKLMAIKYQMEDNWNFYEKEKLYGAFNIHVIQVKFESTTKSGLMRKLNNYLKMKLK